VLSRGASSLRGPSRNFEGPLTVLSGPIGDIKCENLAKGEKIVKKLEKLLEITTDSPPSRVSPSEYCPSVRKVCPEGRPPLSGAPSGPEGTKSGRCPRRVARPLSPKGASREVSSSLGNEKILKIVKNWERFPPLKFVIKPTGLFFLTLKDATERLALITKGNWPVTDWLIAIKLYKRFWFLITLFNPNEILTFVIFGKL